MMKRFAMILVLVALAAAGTAWASTLREDATAKGGQLLTLDNDVRAFVSAMDAAKTKLAQIEAAKTNLDLVATDNTDTQLAASTAKLPAQLAADFTSSYGGINVLAQFVADLSELAGLEGGANEIRLYKNGVLVSVTQDQ